jgi:hypothetical protein
MALRRRFAEHLGQGITSLSIDHRTIHIESQVRNPEAYRTQWMICSTFITTQEIRAGRKTHHIVAGGFPADKVQANDVVLIGTASVKVQEIQQFETITKALLAVGVESVLPDINDVQATPPNIPFP